MKDAVDIRWETSVKYFTDQNYGCHRFVLLSYQNQSHTHTENCICGLEMSFAEMKNDERVLGKGKTSRLTE